MTRSKLTKLITDSIEKQSKLHNKQLQKQSEQFAARELRLVTVQEAIQVTNANLMLRLQDDNPSGDGNPYKTHGLQVSEILAEYHGETDIGSDLVKRIINISAALKVPNGLALDGDETSAEYEYLTKFMEANQLNEGLCTELSKEGEKQGQVLTELLWDSSDNMVKLSYIPWLPYQYKVRPIGLNNMTPPYEITWDAVADTQVGAGSLPNNRIAFVAFNMQFKTDDQLRLVIEGSPTLGNVLHRINDIGADLVDWRQTNKLYAHPTPSLKTENAEEAETMQNLITTTGWTTGSMIISSGELKMVVPQNFHETMKEAIQTNLQFISGATGLSVGWLGFPDLMSNRAVSDSLGEPLEIVAANDITIWKSFYSQMFDNVITMRNENLSGGIELKPGIIKPKLKPMSDRIWQQLIRLYMPSVEAGAMSRETFWGMIPGFDIAKERENFKEQQKADAAIQVDNVRRSNPDNRSDIGQQPTGSRRFNNKQS